VLRFLAPQIVTASRVILGAAALVAAIFARGHLAATFVTFGAITDGLDGRLATTLDVRSDFGAAFDYYADYLCYVVAPAVLSLLLLPDPRGVTGVIAVTLPLLTGAIRYSRNLGRLRSEAFEQVGIPGLGTVIYAFLVVGLVFARADEILGPSALSFVLMFFVAFTCAMMVAPVRYPKLMRRSWLFAPVAIGLVVMPFVLTRPLALCMLALGLVYALWPLVARPQAG
jgi:CDP-diacylglycerol--serine O-phosphatidyltransferase